MAEPILEDVGLRLDSAGCALLTTIVDLSDDAIVAKAADGLITSWKPVAERFHGYLAEEITGNPITLVSPLTGSARSG